MKRLLLLALPIMGCYVGSSHGAEPPPDDSSTNNLGWMAYNPTNTIPDLSNSDAPLSLSTDAPSAAPPLVDALAMPPPDASPDEQSADPDPDAPSPDSEDPVDPPSCDPDDLSPDPLPLALGKNYYLGLPISLASPTNDRIAETARALDKNWAQCYLFVRNQIKFTPCKGVQRGPLRTLLDREGDDADQAFLLLALLQASGFTNSTVYYIPITNGGFRIKLGGTASGYDACGWLGVPADNVANAYWKATSLLGNSGLDVQGLATDSFDTSIVSVEHFWVRLTLNGQAYDLDPSFKPRQVTPPRNSLSDMGYSRSNLLAQAGGTTNAYSVQGINTTNLATELCRLSGNLCASWRAMSTNAPTRVFVGGDDIVPQGMSIDTNTFHGTVAGVGLDFLAQTDSYKNSFRYSVAVAHAWGGNFSDSRATANATFWLDEVGDRAFWYQYDSSGEMASLWMETAAIAKETTSGPWTGAPVDYIQITVSHPFAAPPLAQPYSINRSPSYKYAVVFGFGGDHAGGMREVAQSKFDSVPLSAGTALQRARILQIVGQQWLAQVALANNLDSRFKGTYRHFFYSIGIAAQTTSPYVDLKNRLSCSLANLDSFDSCNLFDSALEHAVLDQINQGRCPAVSTVRIIDLANASNQPVFFATPANWATVSSLLTNYDANLLNQQIVPSINIGHKILLPRNGQVCLNKWKGYGYIDYGPEGSYYATYMAIGGGLSGGFASDVYTTPPQAAVGEYGQLDMPAAWLSPVFAQDPVDMLSGAHVADHTDLSLASPLPLALSRHYDSRQRYSELSCGHGWSHNYDVRIDVHTDPDAFLGRGTPDASVASAVASAVASDLVVAGENAKNMATACLVIKWWTDQLVDGAATVCANGQALSFTRRPDKGYAPAPGVTATLSGTNGGSFALQERLGRTWSFSTNRTLAAVTDPSGNSTRLYYNSFTNLVAVSNSFGAKLTLAWSTDNQRLTGASDSAGRSVVYAYDTSHRLNQVTDAATYIWKLSYNADYALTTQTDPENVTTISNSYNAFGQVTNQLAANGQRHVFAFAAGTGSWDRDPYGRRTSYTYTDDGHLSQVVNLDGTTNAFFYDAQGQTVTNIDALGRTTVRTYDASNNLVRVTEAANTSNARSTSFGYDGLSQLVAVTNPLGRVTRMTYDACHRLTSRISPDGTTVTNVYESRGLPISTVVCDPAGRQMVASSFGYSSAGLATNMTATDAGTVGFRHDQAGNPTNVIDALGRSTRLTYDSRGLLTSTVDPFSHTTTHMYSKAGRCTNFVDQLNRNTRFLWTRSGNPAATIRANGGISTNIFDIAERLIATKDPRGNRIDMGLDPMGRTTNRWAAGWVERFWYGPVGSATTTVNAVGGRTDVAYDWLSWPVALVDPLNRLWQTGCDPLNGVTNSVDARGRVTCYSLDNMGRRIGVTYPSGRTEGFGLDSLGRQTSFTNSEGHVYQMAYDGQNRLIAATNAAGEQVFHNFFDPCGNLTNKVDAASRRILFQYDLLNHCTNTVYADGSSEAFTFDAVGNLLTARNAATTNSFGYDSMNRLVVSTSCVAGVTFTVGYRYDLGGLATNLVYPGKNTVRYSYDADGRVTNVVDWAGHAWRITRDAAGRMTALAYPNGVAGAWQYDASHAVTSWSCSGSDTNLPGRSITRDKMGLKTREDITSGPLPQPRNNRHAVNSFDAADRLISATVGTGTNPVVETYQYDLCGALTNVAYDGGGSAYSYDLAGRMITAYTFATTPHFTSASLDAVYDALGNRVETASIVRSALHHSLWVIDHSDPLKRPLMETSASGVPVRYYIWGAGQLLAVIDADGTTRYAHCDDQGSVVSLSDASGAVVFTASYGPYGEPWGTTGENDTPFGWLGGHGVFHVDGSSLYLTRHRAYDTTLKRFLSADPMGLGGGANLYTYANGNPLAYIDPLGLCGESLTQGAWYDPIRSYTQGVASDLGNMIASPIVNTYNASSTFWNDPTLANGANYALATGLGLLGAALPALAPEADALSLETRTATEGLAEGQVAGSIRNVNPLSGEMNCVNCSIATDATLARAPASAFGGGPQPITVLEQQFGGEFGPVSGPMEIGSTLSQSGNGARGIVYGANPAGDVGHVWNAVNQGGTIRFLDGQTGGLGVNNFNYFNNFQFLLTHPGTP